MVPIRFDSMQAHLYVGNKYVGIYNDIIQLYKIITDVNMIWCLVRINSHVVRSVGGQIIAKLLNCLQSPVGAVIMIILLVECICKNKLCLNKLCVCDSMQTDFNAQHRSIHLLLSCI